MIIPYLFIQQIFIECSSCVRHNPSYLGFESESESSSVVSDSLWPRGLNCLWNSPGRSTGVGSLSLLQGIFPTQESNWGLLHFRQILYCLSHQGSPYEDLAALYLVMYLKFGQLIFLLYIVYKISKSWDNWESCYLLGESEWESRSVISDSVTLYAIYSPWNSPGRSTGVGSLSLLQGIFLTHGSNPGLPHCRRVLYQLSQKGSPQVEFKISAKEKKNFLWIN